MSAVYAWASDERKGHAAARAANELTLRRLDEKLDRFTDMAGEGVLSTDDYGRKKLEVQGQILALRATLTGPTASVDSWRADVERAFSFGAKAAKLFRDGPDDRRRELLGELYANLIVTDRTTKPVLRFPFSILLSEEFVAAREKPCDANLRRAADSLLNQRKNALLAP